MKLDELITERNKVWEIQKTINDKALAEKRELTPEEQEQWDNADADFTRLDGEIKTAQEVEQRAAKEAERQAKANERQAYMAKSQVKPNKPDPDANGNVQRREKVRAIATPEYRIAFNGFLRTGNISLIDAEFRALQADGDTAGGFVVAPEQFSADVIKDLENMVFVRRYAKVIPLPTAASFSAPELANRIGDPTWTAELKVGDEDTTMNFNKRALYPHPLARYIKVSKKLLRVATIDVEAEVRNGLSYEFATAEENAFLNGTGVNQPLGAMVASDNGIGTGRDVTTTASGAIKGDDVWNTIYSLKAQYRTGARWIWHRDALKMIRKLKDGTGEYIWRAGIADGSPNTIGGLPYDESEYMPSTFTTGLYIGLLANWRYYWVVDAMDLQVQVLTELFAMTNQNAYVGRKETDGAPVHQNGFARVVLG